MNAKAEEGTFAFLRFFVVLRTPSAPAKQRNKCNNMAASCKMSLLLHTARLFLKGKSLFLAVSCAIPRLCHHPSKIRKINLQKSKEITRF
ncbi:MAG: hypothetical protein RR946_11415, partial [Clostridia bacterium]